MNSADAGILGHSDPGTHIVYPYVDDAHLVDAVGLFVSEGLLSGEAIILIVTDAHIRPILERLIAEGFNDLFAKYGKPEIAPADTAIVE